MRLFHLALSIACVACSGADSDPTAGRDAGADAADEDADAGPTYCPDPTNPSVHYVDVDPSHCIGVMLQCTTDQNGFQNACGCGCLDKGGSTCPDPDAPGVTWTSMDPTKCAPEPPSCPPGQYGFTGACGCGCFLPGE